MSISQQDEFGVPIGATHLMLVGTNWCWVPIGATHLMLVMVIGVR